MRRDVIGYLYLNSHIKLMGDATMTADGITEPKLIENIVGSVRDMQMTSHGLYEEVAAVVKVFADGLFYYNLYIITKVKEVGGKPVYTRQLYSGLFTTKDDYEDMQIISIEGGDIVVSLRSKPEFVANFVKLLTFKKETGKYVLSVSTNLITRLDVQINSYSLIYIGNKRVAIIASGKGVLGIMTTVWDTVSKGVFLVPSNALFELSSTDKRKINIEYLRCFPKLENKLECVVDSEGIVDYLVELTIDTNFEESGEFIKSIVKTGEFEIPPFFDIKRLGRGKEVFAFLLKKTEASSFMGSRRLLQNSTASKMIDKYTDCNNIMVMYKPQVSKYIYTGITCSEWNNATNVDFSVDEIGGRDYVFYSRGLPVVPPAPKAGRILQTDLERIGSNYISGIVLNVQNTNFDPQQVNLTFVGLNGQTALDNKALSLESFRQGKPAPPAESSSSWIWWTLGILVVLGLLAGVGYWLYMRQQGVAGSSASEYKKADSSKVDDTSLDASLNT